MILLLTETLTAGGAEIFVLRLAKQLKRLGYPAVIFNYNRRLSNIDLLKKFSELEIIHYSFPGENLIWIVDRLLFKLGIDISIRFFLLSVKIRSLVKTRKIRVAHSHLFNTDYCFSLANRKSKIRHVITNHGDYKLFAERSSTLHGESVLNFHKKVEQVLEESSEIICISHDQVKHLAETYGQHFSKKMQIIYNGFELEMFHTRKRQELGIEENDFVFGMVARGIQEKGWKYAIEAFRKINSNTHLILVGKGDYLDNLQVELGIIKGVHWIGFSENPLEWINIFNVTLLPSYYHAESQPNVLLESLSLSKPFICSEVGDVPIILNEDEPVRQCGFTIPLKSTDPHIDVEELYKKMMLYLNNNELYLRHSANAAKRFKDFEMGVCATKYLDQYFPMQK